MRRILLASLVLIPSLFPVAVNASQPADDSSTSTSASRISTGVVAPKILSTTNISVSPSTFDRAITNNDATVVLSLNVDEQGKPQDIQVSKSYNKQLDQRVVDAVRKFRFSPAMLDDQPVPADMSLTVLVQH